MLAPTVDRLLPRAKQRRHDPLRFDASIRELAKEWFVNLSPGSRRAAVPAKCFGKAPNASRTAWSRARNGCATNPIYRICVLLHDAKLAGVTRTKAVQLLVQLRYVVDRLWPAETGEDLLTLLVTEERAESESDILAAMILPRLSSDASVGELEQLRSSVVREIAAEQELVTALDRWIRNLLTNKRATPPASSVTRRTAAHRVGRTVTT